MAVFYKISSFRDICRSLFSDRDGNDSAKRLGSARLTFESQLEPTDPALMRLDRPSLDLIEWIQG